MDLEAEVHNDEARVDGALGHGARTTRWRGHGVTHRIRALTDILPTV